MDGEEQMQVPGTNPPIKLSLPFLSSVAKPRSPILTYKVRKGGMVRYEY